MSGRAIHIRKGNKVTSAAPPVKNTRLHFFGQNRNHEMSICQTRVGNKKRYIQVFTGYSGFLCILSFTFSMRNLCSCPSALADWIFHILDLVNVNLGIQHKTLEIFVANQLRLWEVVELTRFQYFDCIVILMQSVQFCVWVIFCSVSPSR